MAVQYSNSEKAPSVVESIILFCSVLTLLAVGNLIGCSGKEEVVTRDIHVPAPKISPKPEPTPEAEAKPKPKLEPRNESKIHEAKQLSEEFKNTISEFEKHFDLEIRYVEKSCLELSTNTESMFLRSLSFLKSNLKFAKFSKLKNVVLGCDYSESLSHDNDGYYGKETELTHLNILTFIENLSEFFLLRDFSFSFHKEPYVQAQIKKNLEDLQRDEIKKLLTLDKVYLELGCSTLEFENYGALDFVGLKSHLDSKKGSLFKEYFVPELSDPNYKGSSLFILTLLDDTKLEYRNFGTEITVKKLSDSSNRPGVSRFSETLEVQCLYKYSDFLVTIQRQTLDQTGKVTAVDTKKIGIDKEGKLKLKSESFSPKPISDYDSLSINISEKDRSLPEENFNFDATYSPKEPIRIGVMDTGIDYNHPSLFWRILRISGMMIAFDPDNTDNPLPYDLIGHGTHVTGIAANGSKNIQVVPLLVAGSRDGDSFLDAIDFAAKVNVKVVNVSLGRFSKQRAAETFKGLIEGIKKYPNMVFVVAAGNETANLNIAPILPACLNTENLIVVGALDSKNKLATFSNFGTNCVDVAAPGVDILSSVPVTKDQQNEKFKKMSGTSMAAPFVTNLVAKMWLIDSKLTPIKIKNFLISTSVKSQNLNNLFKSNGYLVPEETLKRVKNEN